MAFTGTGPVWSHSPGDFVAVNWPGTQAGYDAAVAAVTGIVFLGPGPADTVTLGVLGANVALLRVTSTGLYAVSKFAIADGTDPTKLFVIDASGIATATTRTAQAPNYSGLLVLPATLGNAGEFLRSGGAGVQPTWASVPSPTNALLDGVNHTDTVAQAVTRGSLIVGNSTPKWDELVIGAANTVLMSNGTDVAWSLNPALQHDALAHLKPFAVAGVNWANGSAALSSAGGFGNVKVGDFIFLGTNTTTTTQGARVLTVTDPSNITADLTKSAGDAALVGVTVIFQPGDHWDNALAIDTGLGGGLLLSLGRGTYSATNTSGTFQEWRGPIRWLPHNSGNLVSDFRVQGSGSTVTLSGFAIQETGGGSIAYFYPGLLTADRVYTFPNASGAIIIEGSVQTLTDKVLGTGNKISVDGTATRTVFQTAGGADRLAFNVDNLTALRQIIWQNYAGSVAVWGAPVVFADGDTTPSVSRGNVFRTANTGATSITTFDDGVDGQEMTIRFGDGNTTLVDGASLVLQGSINWNAAATDTWTGIRDGAVWYEKCRSDNT